MKNFASAGSQRWLQVAVNRKPQLLVSTLQRSGAIGPRTSVTWHSPLDSDDFREYRDGKALEKVGITNGNLNRPLEEFWPARGPVWDALGITSEGHPLFVEAKAHIPEAASPATKATATSLELIEQSLGEARRFYAPRATAVWSSLFYQYANRLAHQYFLRQVNEVPSAVPRQNDDQPLNQQLANRAVTLLKNEAEYSQSEAQQLIVRVDVGLSLMFDVVYDNLYEIFKKLYHFR